MNKFTGIAGAAMSSVMFLSIIAGASLALYTSEKSINIHLRSADLSAELYLTSIVRDEIDDSGAWDVDKTVDLSSYGDAYDSEKGVDLSIYTGAIFSDIKLVPGMSGRANFRLYNSGNINFNYSVTTLKSGGEELLDDLVITAPEETSITLLEKGEYSDFSISYLFRDDGVDENGVGNNNDAKNQTVSLDISVLCTQIAKV